MQFSPENHESCPNSVTADDNEPGATCVLRSLVRRSSPYLLTDSLRNDYYPKSRVRQLEGKRFPDTRLRCVRHDNEKKEDTRYFAFGIHFLLCRITNFPPRALSQKVNHRNPSVRSHGQKFAPRQPTKNTRNRLPLLRTKTQTCLVFRFLGRSDCGSRFSRFFLGAECSWAFSSDEPRSFGVRCGAVRCGAVRRGALRQTGESFDGKIMSTTMSIQERDIRVLRRNDPTSSPGYWRWVATLLGNACRQPVRLIASGDASRRQEVLSIEKSSSRRRSK